MDLLDLLKAFNILANQDAVKFISCNPTHWKQRSPERYLCEAPEKLSKAREALEAQRVDR